MTIGQGFFEPLARNDGAFNRAVDVVRRVRTVTSSGHLRTDRQSNPLGTTACHSGRSSGIGAAWDRARHR